MVKKAALSKKIPVKKTMSKGRPTFYFGEQDSCPIRAAGIIYYMFDAGLNTYKFLLIHTDPESRYGEFYEDFGGRTDVKDKTIEDTVIREAMEESNNVFKGHLRKWDLRKGTRFYSKSLKYLLYLVEAKHNFRVADFGTRELHDDIPRTVEWLPYHQFLELYSAKVSPQIKVRVKSRRLLKFVKDLEKEKPARKNNEI